MNQRGQPLQLLTVTSDQSRTVTPGNGSVDSIRTAQAGLRSKLYSYVGDLIVEWDPQLLGQPSNALKHIES